MAVLSPRFKRIGELGHLAVLPSRANATDAGLDMCSVVDITIEPGQRQLINTGWSMSFNPGWYFQLYARSGLSYKKGTMVMAGVIDQQYRGEVKVLIHNLDTQPLVIKAGDAIAQGVFHVINCEPPVEVSNLDTTARGAGGFGSTGVTRVEKPVAMTTIDGGLSNALKSDHHIIVFCTEEQSRDVMERVSRSFGSLFFCASDAHLRASLPQMEQDARHNGRVLTVLLLDKGPWPSLHSLKNIGATPSAVANKSELNLPQRRWIELTAS